MTSPANRGRARSNARRAARGRGPKPTPAQLRAIAASTTPRGPSNRRLDINPRSPSRGLDVRIVRNAVRRSGLVPYLNERLHDHQGSKSRFDAEALLTALLLTAYTTEDAKRTEVTRTIAHMEPTQRFELNLYDPDDDWRPPSYRTVHKQVKRLEDALRDGWVASDGTRCDQAWFTANLLRSTVPARRLTQASSIAIDGTAVETWGRRKYWGKSGSTSPKKRQSLGDQGYVDPFARYQRDVTEDPTIPEPRSMKPDAGELTVGRRGPDGRVIVTSDIEARMGWKTATNNTRGRFYLGYEAHLAVLTRSARWAGDPSNVRLGDDMPAYIVGLNLTPAGDNRGDAGSELVRRVLDVVDDLTEVLADRGYTTTRPERFLRPLHARRIDVVMDLPMRLRKTSKRHRIPTRKGHEDIWMTAGTPLHLAASSHERRYLGDPRDSSVKRQAAARDAYNARAKTYRWSEKERLAGGAIRFTCPVCAGRASNPTLNPASSSYPYSVPAIPTPRGMTKCCGGTMTVPLEMLDNYQRVPWGTSAWVKSYGRRSQVEGINGRLRNELELKRGVMRAFGTVAATVALTMLCGALNLRLALNDDVATDDERGLVNFNLPTSPVSEPGDQTFTSDPDPPAAT